MDKIKQNPFMAAIGGGLILFVILSAALIFPLWSEKGTLETQIKQQKMTLSAASLTIPGQPDIQSWNDQNFNADKLTDEKDYWGKLVASYLKLAEFFSRHDLLLEWWMTNSSGPPQISELDNYGGKQVNRDRETPNKSTFQTRLQKERGDLEKKLKEIEPRVGLGLRDQKEDDIDSDGVMMLGFNWEKIAWDDIDADNKDVVLRRIQKRYHIRHRVVSVCAQEGLEVDRLVDIYFFGKLFPGNRGNTKRGQRPGAGTPDDLPYAGVPSQARLGQFKEFALPGDLGETLTFGVTVELGYSKVDQFLQSMLNRDIYPNLLINIVGARMTLAPDYGEDEQDPVYQNEQKNTLEFPGAKSPEKTEQNKSEAIRKFFREQRERSRKVRLMLTCQVIDFDPSKLPAWAKKFLKPWAQ